MSSKTKLAHRLHSDYYHLQSLGKSSWRKQQLCFDEISEYVFTFHFATSGCRAEPVHNHSSSVLTRPQLFKRYVDTAMHCLDKSLSTDHEQESIAQYDLPNALAAGQYNFIREIALSNANVVQFRQCISGINTSSSNYLFSGTFTWHYKFRIQ